MNFSGGVIFKSGLVNPEEGLDYVFRYGMTDSYRVIKLIIMNNKVIVLILSKRPRREACTMTCY